MNAPVESYMVEALASIETEHAILGGLMLNSSLWDHVGDMLKPSDFFTETNQSIFSAIMVLVTANKSCDVVAVYEALKGDVELKYLNRLAQFVPAISNMRQYASTVRERSLSRDLLAASAEISDLAQDHATGISERVDAATNLLAKLLPDSPRDDWQDSGDGMVEFLDGIQRRQDGDVNFLPTGLTDLDAKLDGGARPGQVIVIGARPGMGKTAMGLTIGENMAANGAAVGFLSLEMPKTEVQQRRVSMQSGVQMHKLKRPERMSDYDWSQMTAAVDRVRLTPMFVSEHAAPNINQVRSKARALKRRHGLRVLIIDYIGLMEGTDRKANRAAQLGEVSRGLKQLAKELGLTVLLLAQLNREVEKRVNMRPMLSDLRECGDIEQDADVILFVHRPHHIKPDLGDEWKYYAEVIVAKQRDGETGSVDMQYVGPNVRFHDWQGDRPTSAMRTKGGEL